MVHFRDLGELEILALAITAEEEDARIFQDFAAGLRPAFPASARLFDRMAAEEAEHRRSLTELFRRRFGEHIPLVRRQDVRGFNLRRSTWPGRSLRPENARREAALMELQASRFYEAAALQSRDAQTRKLLADLAQEERKHEALAEEVTAEQTAAGEVASEHEAARRLFVLRFVQPGLAGLMDGSVSTLAPLFAAAFATDSTAQAFKVGLAAAFGAGISMGFAEALSDDGRLSGRGAPWLRGLVCGLMTCLGGLGHTLPYLLSDFRSATTAAVVVVAAELAVISWIRARFMDTPALAATIQVVLGGILVFLAGWWIGAG